MTEYQPKKAQDFGPEGLSQEAVFAHPEGFERLAAFLRRQVVLCHQDSYDQATYGRPYLWRRLSDLVVELRADLPAPWWAELSATVRRAAAGSVPLWWEPSALSRHKARLNVRRMIADIQNLPALVGLESAEALQSALLRYGYAQSGSVRQAYHAYRKA